MTRNGPWDGLVLQTVVQLDAYDGTSGRFDTSSIEDAQVSTSMVKGKGGVHRPVLDIDLEAELIPSSTPGHFHLYLDVEVEHENYMLLLDALALCGIIEPGYASASKDRGYTAVRLPWVKKGGEEPATRPLRPGEHSCCGGPHTAQPRNPKGHAVGCASYGEGAGEEGAWPF